MTNREKLTKHQLIDEMEGMDAELIRLTEVNHRLAQRPTSDELNNNIKIRFDAAMEELERLRRIERDLRFTLKKMLRINKKLLREIIV